MQEVILPLCAAAGVAAALALGRMRGGAPPKPRTESDHLESERRILLKSISRLEKDPGYAAERDALLPAYKNRLAEIKAALAGKAHQGTAVPIEKEEDGGLPGTVGTPEAANGATVGVADTSGSAMVSQKEGTEPRITSVPDSAAKPADPESGGVLPEAANGATVGVADTSGSAMVSQKEGTEPRITSVPDSAAKPADPESGGVLPEAANGATVGVADTSGSATVSQKEGTEPRITSVPDSAAKPAAEYPKTGELAPDGRPDAPTTTSQDAEPHPALPKTDIDEGREPRDGSGPEGGDGPDSDEDDLEKIKGDIARAISKLERAETE